MRARHIPSAPAVRERRPVIGGADEAAAEKGYAVFVGDHRGDHQTRGTVISWQMAEETLGALGLEPGTIGLPRAERVEVQALIRSNSDQLEHLSAAHHA